MGDSPQHCYSADFKATPMRELFHKFAQKTSAIVGSPWSFLAAILILLLWLISGPIFDFSDTWQLFINTGTTIITFLMVFLIQNTQNRDAKAIHLKLDELLRGVKGARTALVDLESLTDEELDKLQSEFQKLRERHGNLEENLIEKIEAVEKK
jgi:low affinity Fe/Cu permease